jgi:hypothetical protein
MFRRLSEKRAAWRARGGTLPSIVEAPSSGPRTTTSESLSTDRVQPSSATTATRDSSIEQQSQHIDSSEQRTASGSGPGSSRDIILSDQEVFILQRNAYVNDLATTHGDKTEYERCPLHVRQVALSQNYQSFKDTKSELQEMMAKRKATMQRLLEGQTLSGADEETMRQARQYYSDHLSGKQMGDRHYGLPGSTLARLQEKASAVY